MSNTESRILEALKLGPVDYGQLERVIDGGALAVWLPMMQREGKVRRDSGGLWALVNTMPLRLQAAATAPKPDPIRFDITTVNRTPGRVQRAILKALETGPQTLVALAKATGRGPQKVLQACEGLKRRKLARVVRGKWEVRK